jgi:hypothetical protein
MMKLKKCHLDNFGFLDGISESEFAKPIVPGV